MLSSNAISSRQKCFLPQCNFFAAKIVFFLQRAKCFRAFLFFFWKKNPHPAFVLTGWESRERNREDGNRGRGIEGMGQIRLPPPSPSSVGGVSLLPLSSFDGFEMSTWVSPARSALSVAA